MLNQDRVRMVNCAGCGDELLGQSMRDYLRDGLIPIHLVRRVCAGRIEDRPYCSDCFATKKVQEVLR